MMMNRLRRGGGLMAARRIVPMFIDVMLDRDRTLEIDDRQQHENECLQPPGNQAEKHHRKGDEKWDERKEDEDDHLLAEDVAEEAKRQRHHAGKMADDLDWKIQEANDPGSPRRSPEVLHVTDDALLPDAVEMVIDPGGDRAAQCHIDAAGRRHQPWHQAHVVSAQNENPE